MHHLVNMRTRKAEEMGTKGDFSSRKLISAELLCGCSAQNRLMIIIVDAVVDEYYCDTNRNSIIMLKQLVSIDLNKIVAAVSQYPKKCFRSGPILCIDTACKTPIH